MGGDPKFKASFSCQLQKAYCYLCWWCSCMVQSCEGFESSLFSRESPAERICFHNSYSDQRIVEHQWNTDHWFRLEIVEMLASQESSKKKKALVTWRPAPQNWSKGSGNGCGAEQSCAAIIQRNLHPCMSKLFNGWSSFWMFLGRQKTGVQGCICNSNGKFTHTHLKPPGAYQHRSQLVRQLGTKFLLLAVKAIGMSTQSRLGSQSLYCKSVIIE